MWGGHSRWGKGQDKGGRIDHPGQTAGSGSRTLRNTVKNFGAGELGAERSQ